MPEQVILSKSDDKSAILGIWEPRVFFQIPSELHKDEYLKWINQLFSRFVRGLSDKVQNETASYRTVADELKMQGGISSCYIGDYYFPGCKGYVYDDDFSFGDEPKKKGVLMRDHEDIRHMTEPVYRMAEAFELHLRTLGIPFERLGRKVGSLGRAEFLQVTE